MRKKRRILWRILRISGADKVIAAYLLYFFSAALLLLWTEPAVETLSDSLWYCFATATTVGYGDIAAVSPAGRAITVLLSLYSIAIVAILTAVVTNFFMETAKARASDSAAAFLDDLEHLPELSQEELRRLSEKARKWKGGM